MTVTDSADAELVQDRPSVETDRDRSSSRLRYRLLTGPDDAAFCRRVSDLLDDGYRLHGSPSITTRHGELMAGQALVLDDGTAM